MGHQVGSKSSIVPLIDRLNKFPVGLVDTSKLRELLSLLYEEQEAFIASCFPLQEATLEELSRLTKIPSADLAPILERMADKGLVMDLPYSGKVYYILVPGLIGFFEFTFMKNRTDLPMKKIAELMNEYMKESQAKEVFGSKTPLTRSLAYEEHIPVSSEVTSYEKAREIVRRAGYGAVGLCYCRHKQEHLGKSCEKGAPVDGLCISLGTAAKFLVRRGFAQEKSVDELLAVLDEAKSFNLTYVTDNIREKPSFICNCCRCCCVLLTGVQMGYHDGVAKTGYTAVIDKEKCDYCGACFTACNVNAIGPPKGITFESREERYAAVKETICLGCGACLSVCKKEALTLIPYPNREIPPQKRKELYQRLLKEKGRLAPYIKEGVQRGIRNFFSGSKRGN